MYKILFTKSALKEYEYLLGQNRNVFERVKVAIHGLAEDPAQGKPLRLSLKGQWSYRIGSYRIIYTIEHKKLVVLILDIGHRREIYR